MKTVRQEIITLLEGQEMGARELSQALGIREKEVYEHLPHIARSLGAQGKKLVMIPARCLTCGFVFEERRRFTRPGRCPKCKQGRLQPPAYRIV